MSLTSRVRGSSWKTALTLFGFLMIMAPVARASFLVNGSFEGINGATSSFSIDLDATLNNWSLSSAPAGNHILSCVVFPGATTNLCGTTAYGGGMRFWVNPGVSPDGGNYVAIDGDPGFNRALNQTVTGLEVGGTYTIDFWQAAAQQRGFDGATTEQWRVTFGSEVQFSTLMNNASHGAVGWNQQSLQFTATSTTQVLSFFAVGTPNGLPPFVLLDGVTVTANNPEPGTIALGALGLGALCLVRLRKKKKA